MSPLSRKKLSAQLFWGIIIAGIFSWIPKPINANSFLYPSPFSPLVEPYQAVREKSLKASDYYVLTLLEPASVELQTHTVDLLLTFGDDESILTVDALYRLYNPDPSFITAVVRLAPEEAQPDAVNIPSDLVLQSADQPLNLQQTAAQNFTAQIQIPPDGRSELRLRYSYSFRNTPLPTIQYPLRWIRQWRGEHSVRVNIAFSEIIPSQSWLAIEPAGWTYALSDLPQQPEIKWLYESQAPRTPIMFQFVTPIFWQQLNTIKQQIQANRRDTAGSPSAVASLYLQLGKRYQQLYDHVITNNFATKQSLIRERFYAEALAAYTTGSQVLTDSNYQGDPQIAGIFNYHLANLYRLRVVDSNHLSSGTLNGRQSEQNNQNSSRSSNIEYIKLMLQSAEDALLTLDAESPLGVELEHWRVEGLYLLLNDARQSGDWSEALKLLEQLEQVYAKTQNRLLTDEKLADIRQAIQGQRAIELLAQGKRDAAITIAGTEVDQPELRPAIDSNSLFARWQISLTIEPAGTVIEGMLWPALMNHSEAISLLEIQTKRWQTAGIQYQIQVDDLIVPNAALSNSVEEPLYMTIRLPKGQDARPLAQATPSNANWVFLRVLFEQIAPMIEEHNHAIWQQTALKQRLDLRSINDHWDAMALMLEQQAEQFDQLTQQTQSVDPQAVQSVFRAQIQEINYRDAAKIWRGLSPNSWVAITLSTSSASQKQVKSWVMTVPSSPQIFELTARFVHPIRFIGVVAGVVLGLFLMSGLLWWLL